MLCAKGQTGVRNILPTARQRFERPTDILLNVSIGWHFLYLLSVRLLRTIVAYSTGTCTNVSTLCQTYHYYYVYACKRLSVCRAFRYVIAAAAAGGDDRDDVAPAV